MGDVLDTVPYNYSSIVDCYVQASDGSYWDWLYDTRIGRSGWVYDPYLYTGGNIDQQVDEMHEGNCGQWPLTIPSNVQATAISSGAMRVTWTDTNGGSAKYVLSNGNVSSADLPAGTTSYTWGGLAPNTYMCFTVAAKARVQRFTPLLAGAGSQSHRSTFHDGAVRSSRWWPATCPAPAVPWPATDTRPAGHACVGQRASWRAARVEGPDALDWLLRAATYSP